MIPTREMVHVASAPVQLNVAIVLDPRNVSKAFSKHAPQPFATAWWVTHRARCRRLGVKDAGLHSKLNSGTAVTKRVPLRTRSANWVRTSWAMFQGKMTT